MTQMIELVDRHIKIGIIIIFLEFRKPDERLSILSRDIENIRLKSSQTSSGKMLEKKIQGINGRLDTAEKKK